MSAEPQPTPRKPRRRRLLWAAVVVVFASLITWGTLSYRHFSDPQRVRVLIQDQLERLTGGRVHIAEATFSMFGGVRLSEVLFTPGSAAPDSGDARVQCREVWLGHDPISAMLGRFRLESITAIEPTVSLAVDGLLGESDLPALFDRRLGSGDSTTTRLPTLELRDARVQLLRRSGTIPHLLEELVLTIRGRPSSRVDDLYEVVWKQHDDASHGHLQVNTRTLQVHDVRGGLPSLSVETLSQLLAVESDPATDWVGTTGATGRVHARDFDFVVGADSGESWRATLEFRDGSLSIPSSAEERALPASERFLRFARVRGEIGLTGEGAAVRLEGLLNGSECTVTGRVHDLFRQLRALDAVRFSVEFSAKNLMLPRRDEESHPDEARLIRASPQLVKYFDDYDPHGTVDMELAVARDVGEKIELRRLVVAARGGDASAKVFPYRSEALRGEVEVKPDGVWIRDVCGRHGDGEVCVNGHLERPSRCAAGELHVRGSRIRFDEDLRQGLSEAHRRTVQPFDLAGQIGVEVFLTRAECDGEAPAPWKWTSMVGLEDVSAKHSAYPYPIEAIHGTLRAEKDRVEWAELHGRVGETPVTMSGRVLFDSTSTPRAQIQLTALDAEFSDPLLGMLGGEAGRAAGAFHPQGRLDLHLDLDTDPTAATAKTQAQLTLRGVTIRHDELPLTVTGIEGPIRLSPEKIEIGSLYGRLGGGRVEGQGWIDLATDKPAANLDVRCVGLLIDAEMRSAAPAALADALNDWRFLSPIDLGLQIRSNPTNGNALTYEAVAELRGASVRQRQLPSPLEEVYGTLSWTPAGLRGTSVRALYGGASLLADFEAHHRADGDEASAVVQATNLVLDERLRDALPPSLRRAWDLANPNGRIDLRLHELHYQRRTGEAAQWRVDGRVELHDVSLPGVAELEGLSGTIVGSGALSDSLGGAALSGSLQLPAGRGYGRELTDVEGEWFLARAENGAARLGIRNATGLIYDGALRGEIEWFLDGEQSEYQATATVHGMQVGPWLSAGRSAAVAPDSPGPGEPLGVRGLVDAHLYVSGHVGDPLSRRGGGRVEIREGYIYRLPILLAILNVLQISTPGQEALSDAQGEFFVTGNRVSFESLELRGGALALVGSGTVSLPDQAVDLRLVQVASSPLSHVPLVADLLEDAAREFVELHVTGPLSRPTVRARPFRGLTDELKKIFQKKPKRVVPPAGQ